MNTAQQHWSGDSALARLSSKSNEWYTPAPYVTAARCLMGGIELDPASCALANRTVQAARYYTQADNGLTQDWTCQSMWLNPPYGRTAHRSNQEIWTCQLIAEHEAGRVEQAVLLVNAATDTGWFQRLWRYPICFVSPRINFSSPTGSQESPTHGSVLVYLGPHREAFISTFQRFGVIACRVAPLEPTLWESEGQR